MLKAVARFAVRLSAYQHLHDAVVDGFLQDDQGAGIFHVLPFELVNGDLSDRTCGESLANGLLNVHNAYSPSIVW